jgi:hypothetical protein
MMKNNPSNRGEYGRRSMKKNKLYQVFVEDGLIEDIDVKSKRKEEEKNEYMEKINQCEPDYCDPEYTENIKECWKKYQDENEERLHQPTIDIKSVLIALGVIGIAFGCGVLVTLYYALQPQYPTPLP